VPRAKPLISVVDDDEPMREAIRGLMKSLGFTAEAFSSAEEFFKSRKVPRTSCLSKPFDENDLLAYIRSSFNIRPDATKRV
jgi:hypothetical protein